MFIFSIRIKTVHILSMNIFFLSWKNSRFSYIANFFRFWCKYKLLELLSWVLFDRKNITYLSTCSHTSEKMRNIDAHCFYAFFWGWDKNENTLWHLATLPIDICKPHYDQHNFSPFRNGNFPIMNPIIRIGIRILNLFWA